MIHFHLVVEPYTYLFKVSWMLIILNYLRDYHFFINITINIFVLFDIWISQQFGNVALKTYTYKFKILISISLLPLKIFNGSSEISILLVK